MATKKNSTKKSGKEKSMMIKVAETIGTVAGEIAVGKDHLVEMATGAIKTVKSKIHNITADKKPAVKKAKAAVKKTVKKAAPAAKKVVKAAKKKVASAKKEIKKAVKKSAPVKKAINKAVKKAAPAKKAVKKVVKKAVKKIGGKK